MKSDVSRNAHTEGSDSSVILPAGSKSILDAAEVKIAIRNFEVPNFLHAQQLHGSLTSVGQVCDQSKIFFFTDKEATVLNKMLFEVSREDRDIIVQRDQESGLYEFETGDITTENNQCIARKGKESFITLTRTPGAC